jgi:integrase
MWLAFGNAIQIMCGTRTVGRILLHPKSDNYLASLTGMRAEEILGLRGENVFDDYICVYG